jgi:hypothetical protein
MTETEAAEILTFTVTHGTTLADLVRAATFGFVDDFRDGRCPTCGRVGISAGRNSKCIGK